MSELDDIKKIIKDFFEKTTLEVEIEFLSPKDKTIPVKIKTPDPKILIGHNGQTLFEIQHLLQAISKRKIPGDFHIDLDVNDYKEKKIEYLKETARSLADEVALTKKEKTLEPMPAYERRIIHLELSQREDIKTESIGEGIERRIVIKPS
jgi:spoIIIJ-associated protein